MEDRKKQLECLEREKLQSMTQICAWAGIACVIASGLLLLLGLALPFMVKHISIYVAYTSMLLEALAVASFKAYLKICERLK